MTFQKKDGERRANDFNVRKLKNNRCVSKNPDLSSLENGMI